LLISGLGRVITSSYMPPQQTASLIRRQPACILNLQPFSAVQLAVLKCLAKRIVVIIVVFRELVMAANKCNLPRPAPDQTSLSLIAMGSTRLGEKHENQTAEYASYLEFAPFQHPGKIPSLPFGLSSRLYH
jgi:hypothetical protein